MYIYSVLLTVFGDNGKTENALSDPDIRIRIPDDLIGSLPICDKCGLPKPERAHHCRVCGSCHLRMDHHCPAIGVCVALRNFQPFIVMLTWARILVVINFILLAVAVFAISADKLMNGVLLVGVIMMNIGVSALLGETMDRLRFNRTTLEEIAGVYTKYDLGAEKNMNQIMGTSKYRFLIPKKSKMTGFEWSPIPTRNTDIRFKEV